MKATIASALALCYAATLSAAIITERNDTYSIIPEAYTFHGSRTSPGIDSCWIPYGTYTGGRGDVEYLRVTSNLMGVVASVYDGIYERYNIQVGWTNREGGSVGAAWTNDTLRIYDILNRSLPEVAYYWEEYPTVVTSNIANSGRLPYGPEKKLQQWWLEDFGGRTLSELCADSGDVHLPMEWTDLDRFFSGIPAEVWPRMWPTFQTVYGERFYENYEYMPDMPYYRNVLSGFLWFDTSVAGKDYEEAVSNIVYTASDNPSGGTNTMTRLLSYDTGLTDDDMSHWTNNTTRLDWKRLGLICQFIRQIEYQYLDLDMDYDNMPLWERSTHSLKGYKGTVEAEFHINYDTTDIGSIDLCDVMWSPYTNAVNHTTNYLGSSYPMARANQADLNGTVYQDFGGIDDDYQGWSVDPFGPDDTKLVDSILGALASSSGTGRFRISASLTKGSGPYLVVRYNSVDWEAYYPSPLSYTYTIHPGDNSGTLYATVHLKAALEKSGSSMYTLSDPAVVRTNIGWQTGMGLTPEKAKYFWDNKWVAAVDIPTLELMMSITNNVLREGSRWDRLQWDDIRDNATNGATRAFRHAPSSPHATTDYTELLNSRVGSLVYLDRQVKDKFSDITGKDVTSYVSNIGESEIQYLWDQIDELTMDWHASISSPDEIEIVGEKYGESVTVESVFPSYRHESEEGNFWVFGLFSINGDTKACGGMSTNVSPAHVEAHQKSISRTLWRFKNLRDPDL